jgi:hypothetical protein
MAARGTHVYASTVARWERAVGRLRKRVEVPSERWEAEGWPAAVRAVNGKRMAEFKSGWSFEGAWWRGMGADGDEEVAPEVKKRKFGDSFDANGERRLLEDVRKRVRRM